MELANDRNKQPNYSLLRFPPTFMVANAFSAKFLDEAFCTRIFLDMAYGRQAHCPECKTEITDIKQAGRYYALLKFTCQNCRRRLSAKKGTILENCSLTPRQYILLAVLLESEFSTKDIKRLVGISDESVRQWREKLNV